MQDLANLRTTRSRHACRRTRAAPVNFQAERNNRGTGDKDDRRRFGSSLSSILVRFRAGRAKRGIDCADIGLSGCTARRKFPMGQVERRATKPPTRRCPCGIGPITTGEGMSGDFFSKLPGGGGLFGFIAAHAKPHKKTWRERLSDAAWKALAASLAVISLSVIVLGLRDVMGFFVGLLK
jgi:hypothetical protein